MAENFNWSLAHICVWPPSVPNGGAKPEKNAIELFNSSKYTSDASQPEYVSWLFNMYCLDQQLWTYDPWTPLTSPRLFLIIDFLKKFFFLRERGRKKHRLAASSMHPDQGSDLQPGNVPWSGIEPAPFWRTGQCSIHWATPARAPRLFRGLQVRSLVIIRHYLPFHCVELILIKQKQWCLSMSQASGTKLYQ